MTVKATSLNVNIEYDESVSLDKVCEITQNVLRRRLGLEEVNVKSVTWTAGGFVVRDGKPITPKEIGSKNSFPEEVIDAFNELIPKNGGIVMQNEVIDLIISKMQANGKEVSREDVFKNRWLDVEAVYRKAGWKVEYDKPGYNETYEASFSFRKK